MSGVDSVFLKACRREAVSHTPVWLMRQAGRYMAEYRAVRDKFGFLELCHHPVASAEVTVTAVERLGVDAAIIFADILLVVEAFEVGLHFESGDGPVIDRPVRGAPEIDRLVEYDVGERLSFVAEAVRLACGGLRVPVIGFAGAPFTLASYLIEGRGSRDYARTKRLMYSEPDAWHRLLSLLARQINRYLHLQIDAGASAVQLFDSWVGALSPHDYRASVLEHSRAAMAGLADRVPVIHFGTGTSGLLPDLRSAGGTVIGVDWRIDLGTAWRSIGEDFAVQGNLDPLVLLGPADQLRKQASYVLDQVGGRPGHIFNLGHGILPSTPVDNAIALVDWVHEHSSRSAS